MVESAGFRLRGVTVAFAGTPALDDVSLEIAPGAAVAFVGPSGAGKTTLLRLLNGTLRPTRGTVHVNGTDLATLPRRAMRQVRAGVGFVHQDLSLVSNVRVVQNVLAGRLGQQGLLASVRSFAWPSRAELAAVHRLLERVGIGEKIFERTDRLSGGQQQRVAIARALYQGPRALLADEPVSSVDPARARDTVELLTRISREEHLTLAMSLHDLALARAHFDRLVGLRGGRVVFDGPADALDEGRLEALYDLEQEEMLADGA